MVVSKQAKLPRLRARLGSKIVGQVKIIIGSFACDIAVMVISTAEPDENFRGSMESKAVKNDNEGQCTSLGS